MRLHAWDVDIRVTINEQHDLIVDFIPYPRTNCLPRCEYVEINALPGEAVAYIGWMKRTARKEEGQSQ